MNDEPLKKKVVFLVPQDVHLLDLSGPAHVFYEAKMAGKPLDLIFAGFGEKVNVGSSAGLFFSELVSPDTLDIHAGDFIFIPGSKNILEVISKNRELLSFFNHWFEKGVNLCSICVGVFWLAEAGLLKGKKSTTHWRYLDKLKERYPDTLVQKENLFVIEDNLYMSAGVSSGIDLSLHVLEKLYGYHLAAEISKEIVYYFRRAGGDPQLSQFLNYQNHQDSSILKAQHYIMNNLNKKFTLDDLAAELKMSKRNLSRKFKKTNQLTIGEYTKIIRLERARHLLSKGNKIQVVANECGYKSTNQLRELLR
ncbi:MAG: DJ-1/PfpI family protein [Bacteroidota bacterium]